MSETTSLRTILLCHGAWNGGWSWKKMHPLMLAAGYRLVAPTYIGLGEHAHLAHPELDLDSAIQDVLNVIHYEDLSDIILIGHSFGGMVATGVADRARSKVDQLIYLDAFVPRDGQSMFDINEPLRNRVRADVVAKGGWNVPPMIPASVMSPDISKEDLVWVQARLSDMPINYFDGKLTLLHGEPEMPRSYIRCTYPREHNPFESFVARAKSEAGWKYCELYAGHTPNITAPEALMDLLQTVIADQDRR